MVGNVSRHENFSLDVQICRSVGPLGINTTGGLIRPGRIVYGGNNNRYLEGPVAELPMCREPSSSQTLLLEVRGVLFDEFFLVLRNVLKRMDRIRGAGWDTSTTVNAAFGVNVHLGGGVKAGLVLLGMDAIGGADFNTQGVFDA